MRKKTFSKWRWFLELKELAGALLHLRTVFATGGFPTKIVKVLCNLEKIHTYTSTERQLDPVKISNGCLFVSRIKEWLVDFLF